MELLIIAVAVLWLAVLILGEWVVRLWRRDAWLHEDARKTFLEIQRWRAGHWESIRSLREDFEKLEAKLRHASENIEIARDTPTAKEAWHTVAEDSKRADIAFNEAIEARLAELRGRGGR